MLYTEYLEDISNILGSDLLTMEEKEKFLNDIKEKSKDKDVLEAIKLEDSIEYRFDLVREDAFEQGIEQGVEQNTIKIIKSMLENNSDYKFISNVTGKTVKEIKLIEESIKEE